MDKLKPCPFCGSKKLNCYCQILSDETDYYDVGYPRIARHATISLVKITCECGCCLYVEASHPSMIVNAWNRRASDGI